MSGHTTPKHPYVYKVTRWVREEFEVESQTPLTLEQAIARANDPATVTVEREIAQQVKP